MQTTGAYKKDTKILPAALLQQGAFFCIGILEYGRLDYLSTGFFSTPRMKQPTKEPTAMAARYMSGLPMVGTTNMPP